MSDKTNQTQDLAEANGQLENLDRRQFLGTAAAAGIAVSTGLLACDSSNAQEPAAAQEPAKKQEPAAEKKEEAPAAEAKQTKKEEEAKKEEAPKAEPVQEKAFPFKRDGYIVSVTNAGATEKIKKTNEDVVKQMVGEALKKLTGESDAVKAMGHFIKKDDVTAKEGKDRIGIKVNSRGAPFAAVHPATAFALAELVHAQGIPKEQIVIYDQYGSRMRKAGFQVQPKGGRKPLKPNNGFLVHNHETAGYTKERLDLGGINKNNNKPMKSAVPKVLNRIAAVVNVCVPKDHDLTGITGALKNVSYGNIDRVPVYHCTQKCNPKCSHGECNVSRLYKHELMGGLVRVVVCDALRVLFNGGPQDNMTHKAAHNTIMASTDPVAIDRRIHQIVNEYRANYKKPLKPIEEDLGGRRAPRHIDAAARLGLGVADPAKIKIDEVKMG